jgi:hypothetical protein
MKAPLRGSAYRGRINANSWPRAATTEIMGGK